MVRDEQLYPLNEDQLKAAVAHYPNAKTIVWSRKIWRHGRVDPYRLATAPPAGTSVWYAGRAASAAGRRLARRPSANRNRPSQDAFTLGKKLLIADF